MLYLLSRYIIRYRRSVVRDNLLRAFPELNDNERNDIERDFYHHFVNLFLESLTMSFCSKKMMKRILKYENMEVADAVARERGHQICVFGHQCNWDLTASVPLWTTTFDSYALYKQLHNQFFDRMFQRIRERFGLRSIEHKEAAKRIVWLGRRSERPILFAFNTDQSPHSPYGCGWVDFFGIKTPAIDGWVKLATRLKMPVIYLHMKRHGWMRYSVEIEKLCDDASQIEENKLLQLYFNLLETDIRKQPGEYLWSHRRWKYADKTE